MKKILVTGASGFLGSTVLSVLSDRYEITGVYSAHVFPANGFRLVRADLMDPEAIRLILEDVHPDAVWHLAAFTNVDQGEKQKDLVRLLNVDATAHLASLCKKRGIRLVYTSTDLVYGKGDGLHKETEPVTPQSFYAETKYAGEQALGEVGGDFIICRTALLHGPAGPASHSFSDWLHEGFTGGKHLPLYKDQYRSFLHTQDAAYAIAEISEKAPAGEVYNLGGPERMDRVLFGNIFAKSFGYDPSLIKPQSIHADGRGQLRGPDCSLDISKVQSLIDYRIRTADQACKVQATDCSG